MVGGFFADEAVEGLVGFAGELDGEAGRRADCGNSWDAGGQRFLEDFERGASADEEDLVFEGKLVFEDGVAEKFINGVVPADVFAGENQFTVGLEKGGAVKAPSAAKCRLSGAKFFGEAEENFDWNFEAFLDGRKALMDGVNGGLAAKAAT